MIGKLLVLAAGLAIPFGSPDADIAPQVTSVELNLIFEFVETEGGYDLHAVIRDGSSGQVDIVLVDHCTTIDIGAADETLFGTPALCDEERYSFDLIGRNVVASGDARDHQLRKVEAGYIVLNGVPLLVEEEGRSGDAPFTGNAPIR